jgi:hypothetical protein
MSKPKSTKPARPRRGRPRGEEPVVQKPITFYRSHLAYLRALDPSPTQAIRRLIAERIAEEMEQK